MKLIITAKTGKGEKSTEKEIDKTVDIVEKIGFNLDKKGWDIKSCKCMCDGTGLVLER